MAFRYTAARLSGMPGPLVCERDGCDAELELPAFGGGRRPRFCSTRCRVAAHRAKRTLPPEMTSRRRWLRWDRRTLKGRSTKVPLQANGRLAKSTDPDTWTAYSTARDANAGCGIGFALGDGIGCVDLDHCLVDGQLLPWAAELLDRIPSTYVEVSPSGDGLHIFGLLPEGAGRVIRDGRAIEVYSRGRYMTVTARPWAGSRARLADLSAFVADL